MNNRISHPTSSLPTLFSQFTTISISLPSSPHPKDPSFTIIHRQQLKASRPSYLSLLKSTTTLPFILHALSLHAHILKFGYGNDIVVTTAMINKLFDFSEFCYARNLFYEMPERDTAAWNSMLSGFSRNRCLDEAVYLFRVMGRSGIKPNSLTLSVLIRVCGSYGDRRLGRSVHGYSVRNVVFQDAFLDNSLLVYYNKFEDFHVSERLFERMLRRDIVSWNVMMSGYAKNGSPWRSLELFWMLRDDELSLDLATLEIALQACGQIGEDAISYGESIHGLLVKLGFDLDVYAENSLLLMYCKCAEIKAGQALFDSMKMRNLVSWNIIISGYTRNANPKKAISLFRQAFSSESKLSSEMLVSALQATKLIRGYLRELRQTMLIHCLSIKIGLCSDAFVASSLVAAYGDSGGVQSARKCLDCLVSEGDGQLVCYNSLLSACVHHGNFSDAVDLLHSMKLNSCAFDPITLVNILSLCSDRLDLVSGQAVHGYIIRNNFDSDIYVTSSLLELYIKCGLLLVACYLFSKTTLRNLVSWNTMIHGCVQNGFPMTSLRLFHLMQQKDHLMPDSTSLSGIIEAIAQRKCEKERNYIHDYAIHKGFIHDEFVVNSLISLHAKFHDFDKASMAFDKARKLGSVTWNAMISAYSSHGLVEKAISVFHGMKLNNIEPDSITLLSLLRGLSVFGSLNCIMWIHAIIIKSGFASDVFLGTSLIDLYAKCGELSFARQVFEEMNSKTVVSWNTMIQGYGIHGNSEEASKLFLQMQQLALNPTMVTFLILISACSHVGDIEKGQQYLDLMTRTYSFSPSKEHFSSYIDLLGRCGLVKEVYEYMEKIPSEPGVCAWGSLLGACRLQGNFNIGVATAQKLFELDPMHCGYHALMSSMYSENGRWLDASLIKKNVEHLAIKKDRSWSRVESTL